MADRFTERAIELMNSGQARGRPLHTAAQQICMEEDEARSKYLAGRESGDESPVDSELFPLEVFYPDGSRIPGRSTEAEERRAFEWRDSL